MHATNCWIQYIKGWYTHPVCLLGNLRSFLGKDQATWHTRTTRSFKSEDDDDTCLCVSRGTEACGWLSWHHWWKHCLHGIRVCNIPDWCKLLEMATRLVICQHQNVQEYPHTKTAFCSTGSTGWWMLQHKLGIWINILEFVHRWESSTLSRAAIVTLIFLQHI